MDRVETSHDTNETAQNKLFNSIQKCRAEVECMIGSKSEFTVDSGTIKCAEALAEEVKALGTQQALSMLKSSVKTRILNLIIQDRSDFKKPKTFVESFAIDEDVENPEKALREAVKEFVLSGTDEANAALSYANGYFNWGDAISSVTDALLIKHGLTPIKQNAIDLFVDHDEILTADIVEDLKFMKIKNIINDNIRKGKTEIAYWSEGENLYAEGMAEKIAVRNDKLKTLLAAADITEERINELIEAEEDDDLVIIYETILDEIQM